MAAAPTGRLTKKIQRQLACSMIAPPSTGPATGASSIGTAMMLITRPTRCGPTACARMVCASGMIIPAATPCSTRNTISSAIEVDRPASTEPAAKAVSEISQTRLAPKRSLAQPVSGITVAKASR
jgi:hypothetical protein